MEAEGGERKLGPVIELSAPSWFHEGTPQIGRRQESPVPRTDRPYKNRGKEVLPSSVWIRPSLYQAPVLGSSFTIWSSARGS